MKETTQNQTKAIDVSVLFKCILVFYFVVVENTLAQEKHWGFMKQSTQKGQEHSLKH